MKYCVDELVIVSLVNVGTESYGFEDFTSRF